MLEREILEKASDALRGCLDRVPFLKIRDIEREPLLQGLRPDFVIRTELSGGEWSIVVEVKASGQPRIARAAMEQLRVYCQTIPNCYPLFLAPYISASTAKLCEREGIGYLDLAGNCRLSFGQVYIEQRGKDNPFSEKRELRSLYSPKAERILRVFLTSPLRTWRVQELAGEADVSLGLVSKVKRILEDREWLDTQSSGFQLADPQKALEEWARKYHYSKHRTYDCYAFISGSELEAQIAAVAEEGAIRVAFTGFSAAVRYAPAVRYRRAMVYVGSDAAAFVQRLGIKQVPSGANLTLIEPYDVGVFYGAKILDGIPIASPVQTYLDLMSQKARGEEAAAAILEEVLKLQW